MRLIIMRWDLHLSFQKDCLFKKIQELRASLVSDKEYIPLLREGICQLLLHNITQKIALINHP